MAQNFWTAILAFSACFSVTVLVSLFTTPKADTELAGLVYSTTARIDDSATVWYARPATLGLLVLAAVVVLNLMFF
jgi:SSS family solute:Na+ symporter